MFSEVKAVLPDTHLWASHGPLTLCARPTPWGSGWPTPSMCVPEGLTTSRTPQGGCSLNTRVLRLHMPDPLSPLPGPAAWHVMCGDGSPALDPELLEGRPGPARLGDSKGHCHPPTVAWVAEPLAVSRALRCLHRPRWPAQALGPWFLPKAGGTEWGVWLAQLSGHRDHAPPCLGRPVPCLSVCHVSLRELQGTSRELRRPLRGWGTP